MKKRILVYGGGILLFVGIADILKGGWWGTIGAILLIIIGGIILWEGLARIFWSKSIFKRINLERR